MVLANDYDVELVVRIIGADDEFSDVAVPAHSQRNLESSNADVAYLVVFDEECETRTIITFGDGAPSFSSGGVITMDPVGLGGYEPGVFRPAGTAAQPNGACANALTPPRPT